MRTAQLLSRIWRCESFTKEMFPTVGYPGYTVINDSSHEILNGERGADEGCVECRGVAEARCRGGSSAAPTGFQVPRSLPGRIPPPRGEMTEPDGEGGDRTRVGGVRGVRGSVVVRGMLAR